MSRLSRKKAGCCTLCNQEMYEVSRRWPQGHPYAGEGRQLGRPKMPVIRQHFVQTNGKIAVISFCESCARDADEGIVHVWARALAAFKYERRHRVAIGMAPLDRKQAEAQDAMLRELVAHPIIGVIATERIES